MGLRIMVVDDSQVARNLLKDLLEALGHQVVAEAENLADTLTAYKQHKPDGVTLDLSLVHDSGLDILKAIREIDPHAKVLVISGNSQKKVLDQISAAGAGFLGKPFGVEELLAAMNYFTAAA